MSRYLYFDKAMTTVAASKTAPAAGTVETWTVGDSTTFSDVDGKTAAAGRRQFLVVDPADVATVPELILVTDVSGTTWTVTRGADGTTPTAHSAGFTTKAVPTSGSLTSNTKGAALGRLLAHAIYR